MTPLLPADFIQPSLQTILRINLDGTRTALFGQDSEPGGSDAVSPVVQDHAGCLHGAENKHQCTEGSLTRSLGCLLSRAVIKRLRFLCGEAKRMLFIGVRTPRLLGRI